MLTYECDALPHLRELPAVVVLPGSAEQVQAVVRLCAREGVPFVARGHGTGLSGGALPVPGGVVIALSRLNRVLDVDIPNRRVTVEPGVTNLEITRQVAPLGYYYAPDPSSQQVCSIGGNVAENSGGAHCLKYGFTVHHVLGVEAVLPDGELVHVGGAIARCARARPARRDRRIRGHARRRHEGRRADPAAARERCRRCSRRSTPSTPPASGGVRDHRRRHRARGGRDDGSRSRSRPPKRRCIRIFPTADAVLIVELDGPHVEVAGAVRRRRADLPARGRHDASRSPRDDAQRARIWKGRKAAFAAMGRVSPNYYVQDGVVPRTKLPEVLGRIRDLETRSGLRIGNVFHAGDGNLHPLICYDESDPGTGRARRGGGARDPALLHRGRRRRSPASTASAPTRATTCREMFCDDDLDAMQRVRRAFDPQHLCNPGKVFPTPRLCGEVPGPYRAASGRAGRPRRAVLMAASTETSASPALAAHGALGQDCRRHRRRRCRASSSSPRPPEDLPRRSLASAARTADGGVRGGGTQDSGGAGTPQAVDVMLSTARPEPAAGASPRRPDGDDRGRGDARPRSTARWPRHGQWLPLECLRGRDDRRRVATNDTGPLRHRYGTPRDSAHRRARSR